MKKLILIAVTLLSTLSYSQERVFNNKTLDYNESFDYDYLVVHLKTEDKFLQGNSNVTLLEVGDSFYINIAGKLFTTLIRTTNFNKDKVHNSIAYFAYYKEQSKLNSPTSNFIKIYFFEDSVYMIEYDGITKKSINTSLFIDKENYNKSL